MGATASKSARTLTKEVSQSGKQQLKRTQIEPIKIQNIENHAEKPGESENLNTQLSTREQVDFSSKDGYDPDFHHKAMSLGAVKLSETKLHLDKNNSAVLTLNKRSEIDKIGKDMKYQAKDKAWLDTRTIAALLNDLEHGYTSEKVTELYGIKKGFVEDLGVNVLRVARRRPIKSQKAGL